MNLDDLRPWQTLELKSNAGVEQTLAAWTRSQLESDERRLRDAVAAKSLPFVCGTKSQRDICDTLRRRFPGLLPSALTQQESVFEIFVPHFSAVRFVDMASDEFRRFVDSSLSSSSSSTASPAKKARSVVNGADDDDDDDGDDDDDVDTGAQSRVAPMSPSTKKSRATEREFVRRFALDFIDGREAVYSDVDRCHFELAADDCNVTTWVLFRRDTIESSSSSSLELFGIIDYYSALQRTSRSVFRRTFVCARQPLAQFFGAALALVDERLERRRHEEEKKKNTEKSSKTFVSTSNRRTRTVSSDKLTGSRPRIKQPKKVVKEENDSWEMFSLGHGTDESAQLGSANVDSNNTGDDNGNDDDDDDDVFGDLCQWSRPSSVHLEKADTVEKNGGSGTRKRHGNVLFNDNNTIPFGDLSLPLLERLRECIANFVDDNDNEKRSVNRSTHCEWPLLYSCAPQLVDSMIERVGGGSATATRMGSSELLRDRIAFYSELYEWQRNRRVQVRRLYEMYGARDWRSRVQNASSSSSSPSNGDSSLLSSTILQLDPVDNTAYVPIDRSTFGKYAFLRNLHNTYFDLSTDEGRVRDYLGYNLCVFLACLDDDFKWFFLHYDRKLLWFRFKHMYCTRQADVDALLEHNRYDRSGELKLCFVTCSSSTSAANKDDARTRLRAEKFAAAGLRDDHASSVHRYFEAIDRPRMSLQLCPSTTTTTTVRRVPNRFEDLRLERNVDENGVLEAFCHYAANYQRGYITKYYVVGVEGYESVTFRMDHTIGSMVPNAMIEGRLLIEFSQLHKYLTSVQNRYTLDRIEYIRGSLCHSRSFSQMWMMQQDTDTFGADKVAEYVASAFHTDDRRHVGPAAIKRILAEADKNRAIFVGGTGRCFDVALLPALRWFASWYVSINDSFEGAPPRQVAASYGQLSVIKRKRAIDLVTSSASLNAYDGYLWSNVDQLLQLQLRAEESVGVTGQRTKHGFRSHFDNTMIDAMALKRGALPRTFNDMVAFARTKVYFPACISAIILKCVDDGQHLKNDERVELARFLFGTGLSYEEVMDIFLRLYSFDEATRRVVESGATFHEIESQLGFKLSAFYEQYEKRGGPDCTSLCNENLCPFSAPTLKVSVPPSKKRKSNGTLDGHVTVAPDPTANKVVLSSRTSIDIEDVVAGYSRLIGNKPFRPSQHNAIAFGKNCSTHSKSSTGFQATHGQNLCSGYVRHLYWRDDEATLDSEPRFDERTAFTLASDDQYSTSSSSSSAAAAASGQEQHIVRSTKPLKYFEGVLKSMYFNALFASDEQREMMSPGKNQ